MNKLNEDSQLGFYYGGKLFPIDIEKEGYNLSSELFHFKELRRGIIEHGKTCYIEGYKKHSELFYTFLVKNGYFSDEELHKVEAEFDAYVNNVQAISIRYAEDVFTKLNPWLPQESCLNKIQKDIVDLYRQLNNEQNTLLVQKIRQKGVSTICEIIAYMEAMNNKQVLYIGHDYSPELKKLQNVTYRDANKMTSARSVVSRKFDLIIVDEMITFTVPLKIEHDLRSALNENGRMIITGTPLEPTWENYKGMKDFFAPCNATVDGKSSMLTYTMHPDYEDYERVKRFPEHKNEILGRWE